MRKRLGWLVVGMRAVEAVRVEGGWLLAWRAGKAVRAVGQFARMHLPRSGGALAGCSGKAQAVRGCSDCIECAVGTH